MFRYGVVYYNLNEDVDHRFIVPGRTIIWNFKLSDEERSTFKKINDFFPTIFTKNNRYLTSNLDHNLIKHKLKKLLKKIMPKWLLDWYRNRNRGNLTPNVIFTEIYTSNHWQSSESFSGPGSEIKQTTSLISSLNKLITNMNISSVLDIPCGDFKWMQKVDLSKTDYVGADIVEKLIMSNINLYKGKENIKFKILNLISDSLPKSDIIIVRDCFVHLSFKDINDAIKNIKSSECKYLLTTTFTNHHLNYDIVTGNWRPLNLQEKPFKFPVPILIINENCTENNGIYNDKSMALWEISKINYRQNLAWTLHNWRVKWLCFNLN